MEMKLEKKVGRYVVCERGHSAHMPGRWRVRRAARATTCPRRWGCSTRCSSSASRASCTTRLRLRSWTRRAKKGGSGCDGRGVPRLSARCSGPARGPPPARPARAGLALAARPGNAPSGSPSPLPPLTPPVSRERLHSIACSWPRSFRRVARLGLSLRASKRSLRVAFGSPPLTIPMGWQDMHCGVQTVVPTVCSSQ